MDVSHYVTQLREDLSSAAAAGDEQTRRTAALLGAAIEPAARLAIMNALSDLAAEVTAHLGDRVVELRLDGRDVRVAVSGESQAAPEQASPPPPPGPDSGDISRITLRLVEQIKAQAEQAAASQGVSLNSWVSQAVQGALAGKRRHGWEGSRDRNGPGDDDGRRVRGWVQG
ncbi:MAG: toxin-antitoxin system HicB family antitoxin [Pseudonocardia sp.]|nr:toxin-antitoxin system HicB family antitoxin [Pseudonocardia sp.]